MMQKLISGWELLAQLQVAFYMHIVCLVVYIDYFSSDFNNTAGNTTNETTVNLNSLWKKLDQTQRLLSSTSVHQSLHTGDKFFDLIGILNSSEQFWKSSKK